MANIFSGSEVIWFGVQIEKNGRDFYGTLADKAEDAETRRVFRFLAEEEERHIAVFQKILEAAKPYEPPETYPGEYLAYMAALAGEYVFTLPEKGKEAAEKTKTGRDAVNLGIKFEKESIIFYEGMKKVAPAEHVKIIEKLIDQESGHLFKLLKLRADNTRPN